MRRGIQRNTNYFVTRAVHVGSSNKVINKVKILVTLYLDIYIYILYRIWHENAMKIQEYRYENCEYFLKEF